MKNSLFFFLLLVAVNCSAQLNNTGFYGTQKGEVCNDASAFVDDEQVIKLVTDMCARLGYKNRYIITSCSNIDNCQAKIFNHKPFILYNKSFLEGVKRLNFSTSTLPGPQVNWKTLTVLAHEIGHHINAHLVNPDPNMTMVDMELEADEFSGRLMYMMGATLSQAQAVMNESSIGTKDTYTHPGKTRRMGAIEKGYIEAKRMFPGVSSVSVAPRKVIETEAHIQQQLKIADSYYDRDMYDEAYPIYAQYSFHGLFNSERQQHLGWICAQGLGGHSTDYSEAVNWYRKAAEQGNAKAQNNLGWMYEEGMGVERNYYEAINWYRKSALKGNESGQYSLGDMYEHGKGVDRDKEAAKGWYRKSAAQQNEDAQKACTRLGVAW